MSSGSDAGSPDLDAEEDAQLASALLASLALGADGPRSSEDSSDGAPALGSEGPHAAEPMPEPGPRGTGPVVVNLSVAINLGSARSSADQPAPSSPAAAAGTPERPGWEWRLRRAERAGHLAQQKLAGEIPTVPASPPLPGLRLRVYAILRAREGVRSRGVYAGPWYGIRSLLCDPPGSAHLAPEAVFHGFPSRREAEAYWRSAMGSDPEPLPEVGART